MKEGLELDEDAGQAITQIAQGDMRKVLNILESCSLAHKRITKDNVYEVTGRPSATDIETLYEALNMKKYNDAYTLFLDLKNLKSLAMEDIMRELHKCVM